MKNALNNFVESFKEPAPQPELPMIPKKGTLDRNWQMKKQGILNQYSQVQGMANGGNIQ